MSVSLANSFQTKVRYCDAKQIDGITILESFVEWEERSIFFLNVDDIDCLQLDWIGCMKRGID